MLQEVVLGLCKNLLWVGALLGKVLQQWEDEMSVEIWDHFRHEIEVGGSVAGGSFGISHDCGLLNGGVEVDQSTSADVL